MTSNEGGSAGTGRRVSVTSTAAMPLATRSLPVVSDIASLGLVNRKLATLSYAAEGWQDLHCNTPDQAAQVASLAVAAARGAFAQSEFYGGSGMKAPEGFHPELFLSLPHVFRRQQLRVVRREFWCPAEGRGGPVPRYQYAVLLPSRNGPKVVPVGPIDTIGLRDQGRTAYILWSEFPGKEKQLCGVALTVLEGVYYVTPRGVVCFIEEHVKPGMFVPGKPIEVSLDIAEGLKPLVVWTDDGAVVQLSESNGRRTLLVRPHHTVLVGGTITKIPFRNGVRCS